MINGARYCSVCGKEKEQKHIKYAEIDVYIECECEKKLRVDKDNRDRIYAREAALELRNISSHLSPVGQTASFDTMVVDKFNEKAVRAGKYILGLIINGSGNESKTSLVLQGNRGSGKTYIASAVINDFNRKTPLSDTLVSTLVKERDGCFRKGEYAHISSPCKFITEMELYALYYDNFNYCKSNGPLEEYRSAEKLLIIDDVGSSNYDRARIQAMYLNIIDHRNSYILPTIITTNLKRNELSDYLGDRTYDRLQSCGYFIDLTSPESRRNLN